MIKMLAACVYLGTCIVLLSGAGAGPAEEKKAVQVMIATAFQRGSTVYVKDAKGFTLTTLNVGSGSLAGYTSGSFSVERGSMIYVYDAKGRHLGQHQR